MKLFSGAVKVRSCRQIDVFSLFGTLGPCSNPGFSFLTSSAYDKLKYEWFDVNICPCVLFVYRSMQKLTQLERLDLGSNEFTEVVSICHVEAVSPFSWCPHLTHPFLAFYLFFFCSLILKVAFSQGCVTFPSCWGLSFLWILLSTLSLNLLSCVHTNSLRCWISWLELESCGWMETDWHFYLGYRMHSLLNFFHSHVACLLVTGSYLKR